MTAELRTGTAQTKWPISKDVPELDGKVALVTGANSPGGMGFHTAFQLASKNATVYVGARSTVKAESAIQEMLNQNPSIHSDKLKPFVADLGDSRSVRSAAQELLKSESRLDILVHNAAIISMPLVLNDDGISVAFATNHLGPFVLTNELFPLLEKTAAATQDVRVVVVAATSYKFLPAGIRFNSLASFNAEMKPTVYGGADFSRYSLSKLANVLFSRQLQKKFDAANIDATSIAIHPGLIKTDGVMKWLPPDKKRTLEGRLTPEEGAVTALFAATSPKIFSGKSKYKGAFLVPPGSIEEPSGNGESDDLAEELWATSESVVRDIFEK